MDMLAILQPPLPFVARAIIDVAARRRGAPHRGGPAGRLSCRLRTSWIDLVNFARLQPPMSVAGGCQSSGLGVRHA